MRKNEKERERTLQFLCYEGCQTVFSDRKIENKKNLRFSFFDGRVEKFVKVFLHFVKFMKKFVKSPYSVHNIDPPEQKEFCVDGTLGDEIGHE
jgi:hypothetical protein